MPSILRRQLSMGEPVAFFAGKQASQTGIGLNQNIMFDAIKLNLGNGFRPVHSNFVAPRAGVYLFSATLLTNWNQEELHGAISVNGATVAKIYGYSSIRHAHGSQTVIVHLQADDEVAVRNIDLENRIVNGGLYSGFSGVLLFDM